MSLCHLVGEVVVVEEQVVVEEEAGAAVVVEVKLSQPPYPHTDVGTLYSVNLYVYLQLIPLKTVQVDQL